MAPHSHWEMVIERPTSFYYTFTLKPATSKSAEKFTSQEVMERFYLALHEVEPQMRQLWRKETRGKFVELVEMLDKQR